MPCQDDYPQENLQPKVDNLTRMLCELCVHLKASQQSDIFVNVIGLKGWWVEHKRRDRERVEQERKVEEKRALKKSGLDKLTFGEKKALGL